MAMDAITPERPVTEARAWRISFEASVPQDQHPLLMIKEPRPLVAVVHQIALAEALADSAGVEGEAPAPLHPQAKKRFSRVPARRRQRLHTDWDHFDRGPLLLVWLPTDVANSHTLETELETWLKTRREPQPPVVRAGLRTIRVLWSDGRAVIYAAAEELTHAMDAVIRFTLAARQTAGLEQQMAVVWSSLETHTPLSHAVKWRQQRMQPQVNRMTEQITHIKAAHLRLQTALEQLDSNLNGSSKRLYAELILQAALYDRLETLEDPIEFALDHYELANTRLIEAKHARTEFVLESLIIVVLAINTIPVFWQPPFRLDAWLPGWSASRLAQEGLDRNGTAGVAEVRGNFEQFQSENQARPTASDQPKDRMGAVRFRWSSFATLPTRRVAGDD